MQNFVFPVSCTNGDTCMLVNPACGLRAVSPFKCIIENEIYQLINVENGILLVKMGQLWAPIIVASALQF